ncbi:hypothetical protein TRFO_12517 [Tritrichomonas foetus]|uniref:Protein kinase domain-containing protein n=1 Tax=Tritrichomonas foetus TaxID=1144522 RepID=A0A1J4L1E7_9EUKA|nr:hypothetical protein TRFO_12517 [Tritrichomonas foetus]|eukprot:OHT17343.1 hypothetical protein TRFO_12517 [Tritrichomonas foetus]
MTIYIVKKFVQKFPDPKMNKPARNDQMIKIVIIGEGIYANTFAILDYSNLHDPCFFAMKELKPNVVWKENCQQLVFQKSYHPAIARYVSYFDAREPDESPLLISDFYSRGSLHDYIRLYRQKAKEFTFLQIEHILSIAYGIAKGLDYLHSNKIVHGNLKPSNILLDSSLKPHLSDFMFVKQNADKNEINFVINYTSPELLKGMTEKKPLNPTPKSDIYSFGMILYELLTGQVPFVEFNSFELLRDRIINGHRPSTDSVFFRFVPLIMSCWNENIDSRPTALQLATNIHDIAKTMKAQPSFFTYAKSFLQIDKKSESKQTDRKQVDGVSTVVMKAAELNESHLAMYILGIVQLYGVKGVKNEPLANPEPNSAIKLLLVASDSFVLAMNVCCELYNDNVFSKIDGFDFEEMKKTLENLNTRKSKHLAI